MPGCLGPSAKLPRHFVFLSVFSKFELSSLSKNLATLPATDGRSSIPIPSNYYSLPGRWLERRQRRPKLRGFP